MVTSIHATAHRFLAHLVTAVNIYVPDRQDRWSSANSGSPFAVGKAATLLAFPPGHKKAWFEPRSCARSVTIQKFCYYGKRLLPRFAYKGLNSKSCYVHTTVKLLETFISAIFGSLSNDLQKSSADFILRGTCKEAQQ